MPARTWFRTVALSLVFALLALLADVVGTGHGETATIVRQRSPAATAPSAARGPSAQGAAWSIATRPAATR